MSRASKYRQENEQKLNVKKVFGAIFVLVVTLLVVYGVSIIIKNGGQYKVKRNYPKHYFTSYDKKLKKYGVIDAKGNTVIKNEYDEYILIPSKDKDVFLVTENVDYEKNTYEVKALNSNGNEVLKDVKEIKPIEYYGKTVFYDKNLLMFKENGKYGLVSYEGDKKFEANFDEIKTIKNIPNRLIVKEKDKYGVINTETQDYLIPAIYKTVKPLLEDENTPYIVEFDKRQGLMGVNGKEIIPSEFTKIEGINSLEYVKATKDGKTNIYNKLGKVVVKGDVEDIKGIEENKIISVKNGKWGIIDFNKKEILPFEYEEIKFASAHKYIVKKDGHYSVISKDNKKLEKTYNSIVYNKDAQIYIASNDSVADIYDTELTKKLSGIISKIDTKNGIIVMNADGKPMFYNFKFEPKTEKDIYPSNNLLLFKSEEGKYGFKTDKDKIIVEPKYDDAKIQNDYGFIAVNKDGKWGVLNQNGSVLLEPQEDLTENIVIDFIGEWHRDKDIDLVVYVK